jgi:oligogalacturonide transport system permease protein
LLLSVLQLHDGPVLPGLPLELDESGKLDGCNSFIILKDLLLPLCKSAIFSVIVFQFVWT